MSFVFGGSFALNLRHNDFPLYYHEDEASKAVQVASDTRNFHHPQLMLEAAQWAWRLAGRPADLQVTVEIGRGVSALFASLAAVAAALTFYRLAGVPGLCAGGAAVGLCPALLVYAHYMKEDAALAFGVALTVLASCVFWQRRGRRIDVAGTAFLGAACAAAASAKFAGAFTLVACLPLVVFAGAPGFRRGLVRLALFAGAFAIIFAAINHRVLADVGRAVTVFGKEERHATTRHMAFTMSRPNAFHAAAFVRQTMPHVLVVAAAYALFAVARPRRAGGWGLFLVLFTLGYLAGLSWTVLPYFRYALPVVLMAHLLMALGVLRAAEVLPSVRSRKSAILVAAAAIVALQLPRCLDYAAQFGDDSRERLRLWAARHLPADAVIVQDGYVALQEPFDPRLKVDLRPQFLLYGAATYEGGPAPGAGPLADLRRRGVEYVAVSDFCFGRYLDPNVRAAPGAAAVFEYRRRWYEELFREQELVWSSIPAHPTNSQFNNPELRLYRLRDGSGKGPS